MRQIGWSLSHALTIKVEHYRSFKYCVKRKDPMYSKSKSQRAKASKSKKDSCNEDDSIQRRIDGKRQRGQQNQKKAQSRYPTVLLEKLSTNDLIDLIKDGGETEPEEREASVKVPHNVVDQADDDRFSTTSSVMSGPSVPDLSSANKPSTLCPSCCKLHQRAKRMKAPLKDKVLDTNPKSLTCDQWVLLKPWRRRILPDTSGNLVQLIAKLYLVKKRRKNTELLVKETCSRPHVFLLRNLCSCKRKLQKQVMKKKKNWRKRSREDALGPRVAKQQRLLNDRHSSNNSSDGSIQPMSFTQSSPDAMSVESEQNSDQTLRTSPGPVTSETDNSNIRLKRGTGFKDLLAQLRGNNSMIIRESSSDMSRNKTRTDTEWNWS